MKPLTIKAQNYKSSIYFADTMSLEPEKNSLLIFDSNTKKLFSKYFVANNTFVFPAGEENKNFNTVSKILGFALEKELKRNDTFYAIGGGVVCDLTAFCASVFKRSAKLVLVPTSLLSMVDASVGGKTGFDFCGVKNAIGSFFPAEKIFIFFDSLKSLDKKEYKNGLAEIIKIAMINDKKILDILSKKPSTEFFSLTESLKKVVYLAVRAKLKIVKADLTETHERKFLNLGHTFAHSLESLSAFKLSHGEAVAWGIAQALKIGLYFNITEKTYAEKIFTLLERFAYKTESFDAEILESLNLSRNDFLETLLTFMVNDKKNTDDKINLILQKSQGKNLIYPIQKEELLKALKATFH